MVFEILAVLIVAGGASNASMSSNDAVSKAVAVDTESQVVPLAAGGQAMNAAIREAIFSNRKVLLDYLRIKRTRRIICTPLPNDSYELFQDKLSEELNVLWNLEIYASKYGLTNKERQAVKFCSSNMEKYEDNFALWKKLGDI